jgi:hypothetical protein
MRVLFLILMLANVAFFAWSRYSPADAGTDPLPVGRQIDPDKLRIVRPSESAATPSSARSAPSPAALLAASSSSCVEWGSFTLTDAPRAEKALEPLALGDRLAQRRTEETASWWVFIPPQPNRQTALRKAAELKALGVDDYFVVADESEFRWAVSLGVFRNEDAAQGRLASLRERGVRSAQLGSREAHVPKVWLQVKGVDAALETRLKELARQVEGSELRTCAGS